MTTACLAGQPGLPSALYSSVVSCPVISYTSIYIFIILDLLEFSARCLDVCMESVRPHLNNKGSNNKGKIKKTQ